MFKVGSLILIIVFVGCAAKSGSDKPILINSESFIQDDSIAIDEVSLYANANIVVGAERLSIYLPLLKNQRVAIVGNQSSIVNDVHLVDTLFALNVDIKR